VERKDYLERADDVPVLVTEPSSPPHARSELAIDSVATVLFGAFVLFLVLVYLDPGTTDSSLAVLPLLGSLAMLSWANFRADRAARPLSSPPGS
jgi:hypothetical protein